MDKKAISIIIPVYNTGKLLERCLQSAINQTYRDIEVVVLNNGSTDNSVEIIEKYKKKDSRIKYFSISHVPTGCESRNAAILKSHNEWVVPLDSDDYIEPSYIDKLWRRHIETNADFVGSKMVGTDIETGNVKFVIPNESFRFDKIYDGKQAASLTIGDWLISVNGALMKKSLLPCFQRGDAKPLYNDEYESREILFNAKTVAFSKAEYYYMLNPDSTGKKKSFSKLIYNPTAHLGLVRFVKEKYGVNSIEYKKEQDIVRSIIAHSLKDSLMYNGIINRSQKSQYQFVLSKLFDEYNFQISSIKSILSTFLYFVNKITYILLR